MEKTSYAPGEFCWIELATSDWKAAKQFYSSLFGWSGDERPMGPDQPPYVMMQKSGRNVAALYENKNIHPNWLPYIAVASADDAAKKASSLGAQLLQKPFDVMDVGRMASIQDPEGVRFAIWQAKQHKGFDIVGDIGAVCWNELYTENVEAAREFYSALFDWKLKITPQYTEIHVDGTGIGGMFQITEEMRGTHPMWIPYFAVADCDAVAQKAKSAGGVIYVQPADIPNVGRFAIIADPQGAPFAIVKLTM